MTMDKSSRGWFAGMIALTVVVATMTGMIFSRTYWGYWVRPPSVLPWVHELRSAEALGFVECEPDTAPRIQAVSDSEFRRLALAYRMTPQDYPGYQLLAALDMTRVPIAQGIPAVTDLERVCQRLFRSGVVLDGAPRYAYAKYVRGFVVVGRTPSNERVFIWSAIGGEVSNDHHPVYDLQFADSGELTKSHVYFEDISGIEGARWYVVAAVALIAGTLLLIATFTIVAITRFVARRLRRFAADSGWRHN
jgi:hypothetical protein